MIMRLGSVSAMDTGNQWWCQGFGLCLGLDTTSVVSVVCVLWGSRGEGKIEKVFVLDSHCFIRKIEDFVG